jgi:hypothetical protein
MSLRTWAARARRMSVADHQAAVGGLWDEIPKQLEFVVARGRTPLWRTRHAVGTLP